MFQPENSFFFRNAMELKPTLTWSARGTLGETLLNPLSFAPTSHVYTTVYSLTTVIASIVL
jgi:hypothetical protein